MPRVRAGAAQADQQVPHLPQPGGEPAAHQGEPPGLPQGSPGHAPGAALQAGGMTWLHLLWGSCVHWKESQSACGAGRPLGWSSWAGQHGRLRPACAPPALSTSSCPPTNRAVLPLCPPPQMYKGPKPAPQQAMTERQVADAQAANAAAEAAEAAASAGGSPPAAIAVASA